MHRERLDAERQANLGTALLATGRTQAAIAAYERAAKLAPADARIQNDLGTAYLAQNRFDRALPALKRAVEIAVNTGLGADERAEAVRQLGAIKAPETVAILLNMARKDVAQSVRVEAVRALAGFDRVPRLDMKRMGFLVGGLALLVPFTIAVIADVPAAAFDFRPRPLA